MDLQASLTRTLEDDPFSIDTYWRRAEAYEIMHYPDLAVMDYYKVLLLADEVLDESGEYHSEACESMRNYIAARSHLERLETSRSCGFEIGRRNRFSPDVYAVDDKEICAWTHHVWAREAPVRLAHQLATVGCLRTAYDFIQNVLRKDKGHETALEEKKRIENLAGPSFIARNIARDCKSFRLKDLPDQGLVRREIYAWNEHEQDRTSERSLEVLNGEMKVVAPKLEVRPVKLPKLASVAPQSQHANNIDREDYVTQLGVFAKERIEPGEEVLRERSLLTANARLHEPLCDACSALLPRLNNHRSTDLDAPSTDKPHEGGPVACRDCDDIGFCTNECLELAQNSYHPSVCGRDVEPLAKDVPPARASDALYTQLLFRALALAIGRGVHPLDLKETKSIWGDFDCEPRPSPATECSCDVKEYHQHVRTLPFDFQSQVLQPLHFLQQLDIPIFGAPNDLAETWTYNTLLAKFRGTASARISPRDGRPEVAAVHPLWCLANHSCDPNVQWEWAGEIHFTARRERVKWSKDNKETREGVLGKEARRGGIEEGEEILNHYVDVDLPVQDRREWMIGALGGPCLCGKRGESFSFYTEVVLITT